jgi:hypothetical protein
MQAVFRLVEPPPEARNSPMRAARILGMMCEIDKLKLAAYEECASMLGYMLWSVRRDVRGASVRDSQIVYQTDVLLEMMRGNPVFVTNLVPRPPRANEHPTVVANYRNRRLRRLRRASRNGGGDEDGGDDDGFDDDEGFDAEALADELITLEHVEAVTAELMAGFEDAPLGGPRRRVYTRGECDLAAEFFVRLCEDLVVLSASTDNDVAERAEGDKRGELIRDLYLHRTALSAIRTEITLFAISEAVSRNYDAFVAATRVAAARAEASAPLHVAELRRAGVPTLRNTADLEALLSHARDIMENPRHVQLRRLYDSSHRVMMSTIKQVRKPVPSAEEDAAAEAEAEAAEAAAAAAAAEDDDEDGEDDEDDGDDGVVEVDEDGEGNEVAPRAAAATPPRVAAAAPPRVAVAARGAAPRRGAVAAAPRRGAAAPRVRALERVDAIVLSGPSIGRPIPARVLTARTGAGGAVEALRGQKRSPMDTETSESSGDEFAASGEEGVDFAGVPARVYSGPRRAHLFRELDGERRMYRFDPHTRTRVYLPTHRAPV